MIQTMEAKESPIRGYNDHDYINNGSYQDFSEDEGTPLFRQQWWWYLERFVDFVDLW